MASGGAARLDRFELRSAGIRAILKSPAAGGLSKERAEEVREAAARMYGAANYGVRVRQGQNRVRAYVYTADLHAMRSNALHGTLAKALKSKEK